MDKLSEKMKTYCSESEAVAVIYKHQYYEMIDKVALLEAKLEAVLCAECEKTMLECECPDYCTPTSSASA